MSPIEDATPADLIRWTFTADPGRREAIEAALADLGADVAARDGGHFVVLWDEPEADLDEVVDRLWALNGAPFEVTHESFRRPELLAYQADPEPGREAA